MSRLEPVIRARQVTRDVRSRSLLDQKLLQRGGRHRARGVSIGAVRGESRGACRKPGGAPAVRIRTSDAPRARSTEAGEGNTNAHLSRTRPRERTWTEQAPTSDDDGGKPKS